MILVVMLLGMGCRESAPMGSEIANLRLHDHIVNNARPVYVERLGGDVIWSDKAIIERARDFPGPVKELIDKPTDDGSIAKDAMVQLLQDVDRRRAEWHAAELRRKGTADADCEVSDGQTTATVSCIYANYLEARYPSGKFFVKGIHDVVLLLDGEQIRAGLMPLKL